MAKKEEGKVKSEGEKFKENVDKIIKESPKTKPAQVVAADTKKQLAPAQIQALVKQSFLTYTCDAIRQKPIAQPKEKVIIMGYADSSRMLAPFQDPSFEIWGLNELYLMIPRADRWFEIHQKYWLKRSHRDAEHLKWLKSAKIPIYLPLKHEEIPASLTYPLKEILDFFNINWMNNYDPFRYFNNSISPMIALAVYESLTKGTFKEIHVYGVDMALKKEYREQKPSCEYFIGFAMGAGIKIYIPSESDLLKTGALYGFEEVTDMEKKFRRKDEELKKKIQAAGMQEKEVMLARARLEGALQLNDYYINNWKD